MPKKLTVEQVEQYCRDGYVSPVRAFPVQEALAYRARLEEGERKFGPLSVGQSGSKTHMLFTWADEMIRTPALLDAIEDLIGPDILVYHRATTPSSTGTRTRRTSGWSRTNT